MSFLKTGTEYDTELTKDDVPCQVKIGGRTEKFVPNINASKWDDECWLNINHPDVVGQETETEKDDVVSLEIGNNTHRYFVDAKGQLEYEVVLKEKPLSNRIELDLVFPDGLHFLYQDFYEDLYKKGTLVEPGETLEEYVARGTRPNNVEGSYAVYWHKRNNKYRTGKFCHIYRPLAIDSDLNRAWCDIKIVEKKLTITIPQTFINDAIFPVVVDPTFGYTSVGASYTGSRDDRDYASFGGTLWDNTASLTGKVTTVNLYCGTGWSAGGTIHMGVYDDSGGEPNNAVGVTTMVGVDAGNWASKDVSGLNWPITNGNEYYPVANVLTAGSPGDPVSYDTGGGGGSGMWWDANIPPIQDPWDTVNDAWSAGVLLSFYVEYEGGVTHQLAGTIAGVSTLTGALIATKGLAGTVNCVSILLGNLITTLSLSGQVDGVSSLTGILRKIRSLAGQIAGQSTLSGAIILTKELTGLVGALSGVSGGIDIQKALSGQIDAISTLTGILSKAGEKYIEFIIADVYLTLSLQGDVKLAESLQADVAITESIEEDVAV